MMRRGLSLAWLFLGLALVVQVARADIVDPDRLKDPAQEARAQTIMEELRCLVCQNESIAESNADLAADLRQIVRQRVRAGDTDAQIRAFMVARYGDWILLKPPFKPLTYALWIAPFAFVGLGGLGIVFYFRRRREDSAPEPLSEQEEAELEALLKGGQSR
jgi:cytochrome c-type biogenesis protein CcmH